MNTTILSNFSQPMSSIEQQMLITFRDMDDWAQSTILRIATRTAKNNPARQPAKLRLVPKAKNDSQFEVA